MLKNLAGESQHRKAIFGVSYGAQNNPAKDVKFECFRRLEVLKIMRDTFVGESTGVLTIEARSNAGEKR